MGASVVVSALLSTILCAAYLVILHQRIVVPPCHNYECWDAPIYFSYGINAYNVTIEHIEMEMPVPIPITVPENGTVTPVLGRPTQHGLFRLHFSACFESQANFSGVQFGLKPFIFSHDFAPTKLVHFHPRPGAPWNSTIYAIGQLLTIEFPEMIGVGVNAAGCYDAFWWTEVYKFV